MKALNITLDERENKFIFTDDIGKMAEFVLENNYFQFFGSVKQQISVTVTGTKFAPIFTYVFMGQVEDGFLRAQGNVPLVWLHYIENVFFLYVLMEKMSLKALWKKLTNFIRV